MTILICCFFYRHWNADFVAFIQSRRRRGGHVDIPDRKQPTGETRQGRSVKTTGGDPVELQCQTTRWLRAPMCMERSAKHLLKGVFVLHPETPCCLGPADGIIMNNDLSPAPSLCDQTNNYRHVQTHNEQNSASSPGSALLHSQDDFFFFFLLHFSNEAILFHFIRARVLMEPPRCSRAAEGLGFLLNNGVQCAPSVLIKSHGHSSF